MDKIEVDPKLFITCRLCLEEMGQYQIVPNVQKQIKYCFDIDVDSFDGLPQLICKKCETILTQFDEIKKRFQEKQNNLKSNLRSKNVVAPSLPEQDIVSSTQPCMYEVDVNKKKLFSLTLKKKSVSPDCQPTVSSEIPIQENNTFITTNTHIVTDSEREWRKNYDKYFSCKFCSNKYKNRKSVMAHMEKHSDILKKYGTLLKECKISLQKIDEKPNITGMTEMVVIEEGTILHNKLQYNICYKRKKKSNFFNVERASESSDDEVFNNKKRRRLRVLSNSSKESVVIGPSNTGRETPKLCSSKSKFDENVLECVDIDSSESGSEKSTVKKPMYGVSEKTRIISQIILSCYNKYIRRDEPSESRANNKNSQLQHKILSIGRKIINKKGFNCTGLLRYLENKNLDIEWIPKTGSSMDNENVRIRTKLRDIKKDETASGWKNLLDLKKSDEKETFNDLLLRVLNRPDDFVIPVNKPTTTGAQADLTECFITSIEPETHLKRLLNANPVDNPKKLPSKVIQSDKSVTKSTPSNGVENRNRSVITELSKNQKENRADIENTPVESNKEAEATPVFVQRIKLKPVSELMAEKSTNFTSVTTTGTWNVPESPDDYRPLQNAPTIANRTSNDGRLDYVIMHTVELPNNRTLSPFKYFQSLLHIHSLVLLDTNVMIPSDFICLVKFRSNFQQESKAITFSLSLHSNSRAFYIKVTDAMSTIDVMTLPPSWQWEMLKLYRNDIVISLLENAKKISQQMFSAANCFVSLLKSIEVRRY